MAILNHGSTIRTADGGQSTTTIVTASNIGTYGVAANSTYYVGTTQNIFNRASGAQTLTGVSIDGNAATVTNGVYTTGAQTIGGTKTFSDGVVVNGATYYTFNKPTTNAYQTVALFGSAGGGLFLTTDSAIIGVGAYYNNGWIATATSGRQIDFAGGSFTFNAFSGATVGGAAGWSTAATLSSAGSFVATGDVRTIIFYDSNNTAYYCDPASTSNLVGLTVANTITGSISGNAATATNVAWSGITSKPTTFSGFGITDLVYGSTGSRNVWTVTNWNQTTYPNAHFLSSESSTTNAPSTDFIYGLQTAFHRDGASYRTQMVSELYSSPVSIWVRNSRDSDVWTTWSKLLHSNNYSSYSAFTTSLTSTIDARAPIFYDSNDTTYYIDPASTSRVVALWVRGSSETIGNIYVGGTSAGNRLNISYDQIWTPTAHLYLQYSGAGNIDMNYGGGVAFSRTSLRAPIFYDFDNTAFYTDPASTSVLNKLTIDGGNYADNYFQSFSDFTSGTLVTTDIPATAAEGESFVMNVVGKSYSGSTSPFNFSVQGYLYNSTIINYSGIKLDSTGLATIKIFQNGGVLCFWWATVSYWNAFEVSVRGYNSARSNYNRVTNITNSTEPVGTKKVAVTLQSFLRADVSATNSVDLRAPIFYDSNDTTYYTDPSSLSNILELKTNKNWYDSGTTVWGGGINIGGNNPSIGFQNTGLTWWYMLHHSSDSINFYRRSTSGGWNQDCIWDNSGNFIWRVSSIRAPIFYDFNNTAYYLDPAGTSILDATRHNSIVAGSTSGMSSAGAIAVYSAGSPYISFHDGTTARTAYFQELSGRFYFGEVTYTESEGSFRAPLFYDSNNTAYYLDPASTSRLNIVHSNYYIGEITDSGNGDSNAPFRFESDYSGWSMIFAGTPGSTNGWGTFWAGNDNPAYYYFGTSNPNEYVFVGAGSVKASIDLDNGQSYFATSLRSPIFYDSDNTAYYIDPASGSNLNTANANRFSAPNNGLLSIGDDSATQTYNDGSTRSRLYVSSAYPAITLNSTVTSGNGNHGPTIQFTFNGYDSSRQWVIGSGGTGQQLDFGTAQPANKNPHEGIAGYSGTTCMRMTVAGNVGIGGSWGYYGTVENPSYRMHVQGTGYASGDFRAPIFYDSNNTAYYLDPASTSNLNNVAVAGTLSTNNIAKNSAGSPIVINSGLNASLGLRVYYDMNLYNTLVFTDSSWNSQGSISGSGSVVNIVAATATTTFTKYAGHSQEGGSFRAPIFYDSNDTGYYCDPASNSVLNGLYVNAYYNLSNDYKDIYVYGDVNTYYVVLIQGEYLYSFGRYSVTRGYNWTGPDTWYIATHKGGLTLDWEWSGDTAWGGNDKAIRIIEFNESYSSTVAGLGYPVNGGVIIWLRGGGVGGAQYRIRTPIGSNATVTVYDGVSATNHSTLTTFTAANSSVFTTRANTDNVSAEILARYPVRSAASLYNDNNLVVDIGSGTQTKSGIFASAASVRAPIFYDTDNTGYYCDPAGSSNFSIVTAADFYTAGWFRNNTNGHGMYNQATGQHFYSDSVNYWNVASSANAQGIRLRTGGYNGTVRGYFYADTNNDVGFLNQDGSWRLRVVGGDYSLADGSSMRAQLFYDSNDTAYYVNPNSTSNLYYITMPHIGNGSANLVVNNGGSENWNAIKINGGNDNNGIGFSNTSHSAFGRNNFSFHTHNLDSIRFHSSGWDTLFEVAGSSGNAWLKGGSFDSSFTRLVNPGGAYYVTGTSTITGAIKIRLPRLNANTMMRMTVKIYQYNTGQCATIECGGYDYSGDGIWRNIFAYQNSDLFATVNVRFGNDGTYDCVWIGETSSTWSYPQVFVTDFQAGYNNYTSDWGTGWNISFVTTFNTVTDTRVAYKTLNAGNYNSYAPTLTGTGASGTWSINVTGNAATVTNGLYTSSTLTAGNLSGTIPSGVLGNSTHYVGTTAIALNRASAGQTLTGISIDGNSGGIYAAGQAFIQTTSAGTSYVQHIQVREAAGGGGLTSEIYAPALGFHWSGVVASNILMESSGRMSIRNNPGTSYENFIANIVYGNSSVQTPILYDSNDTAYYLDPRSTSVLSGLKLNGVDNEAAGTGSDAILWINKPNNNDWGIRVSGNLEYLLKLEGATSHTYNIQGMANGSEFWRCGTDLLYHNSNIRAPIFYDSNNTAYYLDPNSTTSLRTVGSWRSDSSTWDGEFSGKIQYHSNHWYFQSGDLWIFRNSGGTNVATINQSGTISAAFSGSLTGNVTGNVTGTAINIAGNGAGADPYGTIAVTEPANASNYSYYGLTRQANIGAGFGLTGTTGALGFGANAFWFGGATSTAAGVMSSAYIAFNGSSFAAVGTVDATQFRDRDNTAYYIDAASTSNLLGLTVTNTITGNISGTAGSISGFNNPTTAATANTIVYRDSGGDIYGRYLFGSYQNSSDDTSSTGITFIMAKFGDNYHRSASAAKVATFISGQTMNINGSSTSCSGTATTATTANALNTSNSYTIAGLTNNGTATLFPTYGSGYSYFLRMGYDTSGYYDYTIKRDGNTGLLEFNGTQGAPYVGYVFSGGNVGVGTTTPGYKVDVNGSCHATCFPTSSDIRFKKKITPLENSLEKIKKLQGVKYEWNEFVNSVRDGYKLNIPIIGLIAQDVEKVIPEIIDFWKLSDDCQDARSIDYPRLIPFLIEAIKEQQIIIENQNQKIENLMTRMSALEAK